MTAIIDNRHMWKDGEQTRQYRDTDLVYDEDDQVFFVDNFGKPILLKYEGYDCSNDSLRYKFHPGNMMTDVFFELSDQKMFESFRKSREPVYKFKRLYNERTAVQRVNGRLYRDFLFENHNVS